MANSLSFSNKRIAKNTILLYIRMFFVLIVTLYTSRVVLITLGIDDFGIYNVVAGFVTMFGFMNNSMMSATQRFLSYELGLKGGGQVSNVFTMSVNIHLIIAIIVLVLGETIGIWFVKNKLVIPDGRELAALLVFRFSIFTLFVNIISSPYNALIVAHEKMGVFAIIGVIEVICKLLIVFLLQWYGFDKLALYAILIFTVAIFIRLLYGVYCRLYFKEIKFKLYWNQDFFKDIFKHTGWMLIGTSSQLISVQGVNTLLNLFFDVTVNAARGIAFQVRGAVQSLVVNFMIAVRPQIIKRYAQGEISQMNSLVFSSAKFSFYLLLYFALPVFLFTEIILNWWLKQVPDNAVIFTRLIIIELFFVVLFTAITTVSQAANKIKLYQSTVFAGNILVFVLTYILFKLGFYAYFAFIVMIIVSFISLFARLFILRKEVSFPMRDFLTNVFLKCLLVTFFSIPIPYIISRIQMNNVMQFTVVTIVSFTLITFAVWVIGLNKDEKSLIIKFSKNVLAKNK